jgi:hypothetical protein
MLAVALASANKFEELAIFSMPATCCLFCPEPPQLHGYFVAFVTVKVVLVPELAGQLVLRYIQFVLSKLLVLHTMKLSPGTLGHARTTLLHSIEIVRFSIA